MENIFNGQALVLKFITKSGLLLLPHPDLVLLCFAVQLPLLITTHGFCGGGNALEDLAMIASSKTAALDFFDFVMKAVDLEWFGLSISFVSWTQKTWN